METKSLPLDPVIPTFSTSISVNETLEVNPSVDPLDFDDVFRVNVDEPLEDCFVESLTSDDVDPRNSNSFDIAADKSSMDPIGVLCDECYVFQQ